MRGGYTYIDLGTVRFLPQQSIPTSVRVSDILGRIATLKQCRVHVVVDIDGDVLDMGEFTLSFIRGVNGYTSSVFALTSTGVPLNMCIDATDMDGVVNIVTVS